MRKMMKKLLVFALVMTMITSNCMTSFAAEDTDGNAEEVVCTGLEDCIAEEHEEGCLSVEKDEEPEVICTGLEDCEAEEHEEGCLSVEKDEEPEVICTGLEDCAAEEHNEGCLSVEEDKEPEADKVEDILCSVEGCELAEGHPGECTGQAEYTEETPEIDTEEELASALAKGGDVVLGGDIEVTAEIQIPTGVIATLDLNGYKITSIYNESTEKHIYPLNNYGTLTIMDLADTGAIIGRGIYNQAGAKITINDAKIVAEDWNGGACVWSYGTGEVYLNDAEMIGYTGVVSSEGYLEINGGTYTCYSGIKDDGTLVGPTYNIRAYNGLKITDGTFTGRHGVISVGGGEAVIENGNYTIEFTGVTTSNVVYVYGDTNLTINAGKFISDNTSGKADSGAAVLVSGSNASLTINDGAFVGMNGMISGNSNTVINAGEFSTVFNYNHYEKLEKFVSNDSKIISNENGFVVIPKTYVAEAGGKKYENLKEAIDEALPGTTVRILTDGKYTLPTFSKKLTIEAAEGVDACFDMSSAKTLSGAEVVFNDLTFEYQNANYIGLHHVKTVEYNNCTINGQIFLYGEEETFNNCTFNQTSADAYNVWTYGSKKVGFNECTFNSAGKSVLVYNEGACATELSVVDCEFIASSPVEGKAAIEIDTTLMPDGTKIIIDDMTTATGFAKGSISGNSLWNDKKNQIDLTVTVAEELVWPIMVAEVGGEKFPILQKAVDAAMDGATVTLLQDAAGAGVVVEKDVIIDFAGYTYTVNSAVGSTGTETLGFQILAGSNAIPYDVTLKNGTIAVAEDPVAGSKEIKAVIMNYSDLTLENMTVDGTGNKELQFALSTNNGTLTLTENTNIKVNSGVLALDIDGSQAFYSDAKAVIETTGGISGRVDIYGDEADVVIKHGGFSGSLNITGGKVSIENGYFTQTPPSEYIIEGKTAVLQNTVVDGVTYLYVIGDKAVGEPEKAVSPAEPEVSSNVTNEDQKVQKVVEQVTQPAADKGTTSFESTLPEASEVAADMNSADHTEAFDALNEVLTEKVESVEDVTIHIRPYLDVQVEDVDIPADNTKAPTLTLDIEMKYDVVVSKEKDAEDIVTEDDVEEGEKDKINAVVTEEGETLEVEKGTPVEITVPLPEVFNIYLDTIIVKHVKDDGTVYYYDATVNKAESTITFVNTNGFSTFIITADSRSATVDFQTSDETTEQVVYKATDVNTTSLPTATKAGYTHKGWTFEGIDGTYSGKMTENLLNMLAGLSNGGTSVIKAAPVFTANPPAKDKDSSDSKKEETKTEESSEAQLVQVAMVSAPVATGDSANTLGYVVTIIAAAAALAVLYFRRRRV